MKKRWLAAGMALVMAGTLLAGAGCGETAKPVVTVQDGYVYVNGERTDIEVGEKSPQPGQPSETKSAFELWKEENPSYQGTEEEWTEWLENLVDPPEEEEESVEYTIIENGVFAGTTLAGSAETKNGALVMSNARLRLSEGVALPFGESGEWKVDITGKLLARGAAKAQFFAGSPFENGGRVYFGVNTETNLIYLGVRLHTMYVNYGWKMQNGFDFTAKHSYSFRYDGAYFLLAIDGGKEQILSDINFNQQDGTWLDGDETDAQNFSTLVRTVTAQDYAEMTSLGAEDFAWSAEIENFTVTTTPSTRYKRYLAHPLSGKRIFYLGSSITYGYASGNPFQKEAVSGTTLVDNGSSSYVQRLRNFNFAEKPDYLVVQLSTNDFSTGKDEGSVQSGTASSGFNTGTVSGAIQYIIAYAKEQCPTCKVVFYTGAVKKSWSFYAKYESYINGDFAAICTKWGIEPLDLFHASYKSYSCFWRSGDDIHPTLAGYAAGWTPLFMQYFMDRI